MDVGAKRLLETVTIETLHAHQFSRASSQATLVLTDLLSRYLTLLSTTCAKYAEHAGRLRLNARDAEHALRELGVDVAELSQYCATEGREMSRYAVHTARRVEDLNDFKALLSSGLREDHDDAIPLIYGPVPEEAFIEDNEDPQSEREGEEEEPLLKLQDVTMDSETVMKEKEDERMESPRPLTPPLPLSPISNPSTPPRKRPRTAHWEPPPHIPDFLPPFPSNTPRNTPSPPPTALPPAGSSTIAPVNPVKLERPVTPPPEVSFGAADYRTSIPYSVSSISSQPTRHLPARMPSPPPTPKPYELPVTQSALYQAYHHVLTHPPSKDPGPANPARYKVALELIEQTENESRWEPHCTLYGVSTPNAPRVAPIGPSYPQVIADASEEKSGKDKGKEADVDARLPKKPPRSILGTERIAPLISQQPSRIPALALRVLPGPIHTRTTKVTHPPVLSRGTQKLLYGPGVNAHWNSGTGLPGVAPTPQLPNGVKKEKDKDTSASKALPDAKMYATWSWDQKSYREPLSLANRRMRMGSVQLSSVVGNGRRASESRG
ncbi:hypothetical protein BC835DRAFT_1419102 [Cytidiella melzeri]|nr:hypothetical protein BC835DRAFT_1419102 [Cytidiella melzeri]